MPENPTAHSTRYFFLRYALALSMVATLSISAYGLVRAILHQQASDASVINLSGRQRMLSQKLTKEVLLLIQAQTPEVQQWQREQLVTTLSTWSRVHRGLQEGDEELKLPANNTQEIRTLFAEVDPPFQSLKQSAEQILALEAGELAQLSTDAPVVRDIVQASALYLQWMDRIVFQYEQEAQFRVNRLTQFETYVLAAILLLLALEGMFIFLPMILQVRKTYGDFQRSNEQLRQEISERQQVEERLQQAHNELERRVEERTAELQKEISERQQAERHYQTILRTAMDGFFVVDNRGNFLEVNDAYCQMIGYSREELLTMGIEDVDEGQAPEQIAQSIQQVTERGHGRFEVRHRRKDGQIIDIEISTNYMDEEERFFVFLRDTTARKQAENELRESEERNRTLVKESHHRIKNNLQIISSLLDLEAQKIEDEALLAVLQDSGHRVRTLSLIHERLYRSADLTQIDLADYLRTLTKDLVDSSLKETENISLDFQLEGVLLGMDAAVSCGLIVNELVTNAIQHAFPQDQKGTIGVGLQTYRDNQLRLTVWDNGRGIPPEIDFLQSESLGLKLVASLIRQIGGKAEIERNGGTRFEIVFRQKAQVMRQV